MEHLRWNILRSRYSLGKLLCVERADGVTSYDRATSYYGERYILGKLLCLERICATSYDRVTSLESRHARRGATHRVRVRVTCRLRDLKSFGLICQLSLRLQLNMQFNEWHLLTHTVRAKWMQRPEALIRRRWKWRPTCTAWQQHVTVVLGYLLSSLLQALSP